MFGLIQVANPLVPTVGEGIGSIFAVVATLLVIALVLGFLIWSPRLFARKGRNADGSGVDSGSQTTNTG